MCASYSLSGILDYWQSGRSIRFRIYLIVEITCVITPLWTKSEPDFFYVKFTFIVKSSFCLKLIQINGNTSVKYYMKFMFPYSYSLQEYNNIYNNLLIYL